jgi:hypothetical protein
MSLVLPNIGGVNVIYPLNFLESVSKTLLGVILSRVWCTEPVGLVEVRTS